VVVVVIIGILGALIILGVGARPGAWTAVKNDLRAVANASKCKLDNFPIRLTSLQALVTKPSGFPEAKNFNRTVSQEGARPWGMLIVINTGDAFIVFARADGVEGGEGKNAESYDTNRHHGFMIEMLVWW
jgi:general secretion pathway protein G